MLSPSFGLVAPFPLRADYSRSVVMYAMTSFKACSSGRVNDIGRITIPVVSAGFVPRIPALKFVSWVKRYQSLA